MVDTSDRLPGEGLRERHRRRTAALLEEAALRLFAERGVENVTVEEIAAAAEVSRRTFFRYFASKEDVLLTDHKERLAHLRAALEARPADEPALTALRQAFLSMAGSYEEERERLLQRARVMQSSDAMQSRSLGYQTLWEDAMTDMMATRMGVDPDRDLRPGVIAVTTLACLRVATGNWLASDGQADMPRLVAEALDLLDGGLQAAARRPS